MAAREQQAIITAYTQQAAQLRQTLLTQLITLFYGLGSWRDRDTARWTPQAVPLVAGAQRQVATLTAAYLAALIADMLGTRPRPVDVAARTGRQLRPVDPDVLYARPIREIHRSLGSGRDFPDALDDGVRRLVHIAATDLQLAKTHAARDALDGDDGRIVGYKRVLTGDRSCGLCVVASTQRYLRGELLPIHPGCDCAVAPIIGDADPGQVINEDRLEDVHDAIQAAFGVSDRGGRDPIDYRDVLVVHEHGEIGPVLARAGHHFTGPGAIAAGAS